MSNMPNQSSVNPGKPIVLSRQREIPRGKEHCEADEFVKAREGASK